MVSGSDPALKLWIVLNRAVRSIEGPLRQQVEAHGLSYTEFAVLEALLHKGPLPIGEIGSRVLLTSGSMTYVIDKLEYRGLLQRHTSETDRRVIHAQLTDEGHRLIATVFEEHEALIRDLSQGLTAAEQHQATALLKRLGRYAQHQIAV